MRFSVKLILIFGAIIFFLSSALTYIVFVESRNALQKEIITGMEDQAFSTMNKIDMMLSERHSDLQIMTTGAIIGNRNSSPQQITDRLIQYRDTYKSYLSLSFFDVNRTRVADTSGTLIGEKDFKAPYWAEISGGETSTADYVAFSEELNSNVIFYAAPVRDEDGIFGAVVTRIPLSRIYDIISGSMSSKNVRGLQIDLVDKNGLLLFSTHNRVGVLKEVFPGWGLVKDRMKGKSLGNTILSLGGEEQIIVFAEEQGYLDYPGHGWIILIHTPVKIAFSSVYSLMYQLLFIISLLVIIFSVIIGFTSRKMLDPLNQIYHVTKEIGIGNFSARTSIKSGDEFEAVGEVINKTALQLSSMEDEKKQIDKAKTEFLSITTHELRSPMTPMKAQLQMLEKGYFGNMNPKQSEAVDIVLRNTDRLDKIISDFLEISRIEAARLKFHFTKTDLSVPVKTLIQEMGGFLPEKNIKVVLTMGKLPAIEVDSDRVMQVLRNLLNNAKKFSPDNSRIYVDVRLVKGMIEFSVKDEGIGISPGDQKRLFEPFYQAEQTIYRQYGGAGLGLAICKGIIESQNGTIWLESAPQKGTTFHFTVPLSPVKEARSIRLLFSSTESIDRKIEGLFTEMLGPIGSSEFEDLKKGGVTKESLYIYINSLVKKGIISVESGKVLRSKVNFVLNPTADKAGKASHAARNIEDFFVKR